MTDISDHTEPDTPPVSWTPPRPTEIPALHANLQRWLSYPFSLSITCAAVDVEQGTITPVAPNPLAAAVILHNEEIGRLRAAHLYAVDEDMAAVAIAAGVQLPDLSVQPADLPAEAGFVVYDSPIGYSEVTDGEFSPIVACSWGTSAHCSPPVGAVWLTFWSPKDDEQLLQAAIEVGIPPEEARLELARAAPLLQWHDEALLCWSAGAPEVPTPDRCIPSDEVTGILAQEHALPWIRTVVATWLLIQQPTVVEVTDQRASRPERRRAERAGRPLSPVRVVSIHRRVSTSDKPVESTGRTVGVRSLVNGFWRNQPYGKGRALYRRQWINEHWRGPEDAPVLIRPTVTVVDAPPEPAG